MEFITGYDETQDETFQQQQQVNSPSLSPSQMRQSPLASSHSPGSMEI